jgi:HKD family nuclease
MEVIWNTTEKEHESKLMELFQSAASFECAVAFVKMSGFNRIRDCLKDSLRDGMSARFIIGLDFYITDPDVLDTLLKWEKTEFPIKTYVSRQQYNVCFHPKIYAFTSGSHTTILTGSANLTGGGLGDNWECSVLVRYKKDNDILRHLQTLIDDKEVDELTDTLLAEYRRGHRIARAVRSAADMQIARLTNDTEHSLEPLEAIVRELKMDTSPNGLKHLTQDRANSIEKARVNIGSIIRERPRTEADLLPAIRELRKCFHSGSLERQFGRITRSPLKFLQLLGLAHQAHTNEASPSDAYEQLRPVANEIAGIGPNWISEILHALDPSKYAVLNRNSVAGIELAGIEYPSRPTKSNISSDLYGDFCEDCHQLAVKLGLSDLSELDAVFNHAYWNYESGDE